jgi:hypothetical protein
VPLDDEHLQQTIPYVELNPVRAGLVVDWRDWQWSTRNLTDGYVSIEGVDIDRLRGMTRTGRPICDKVLQREILRVTGISIDVRPRGRPRACD